jgi:prepilin-type N-terminal cleavage/methylation domain-containing protein
VTSAKAASSARAAQQTTFSYRIDPAGQVLMTRDAQPAPAAPPLADALATITFPRARAGRFARIDLVTIAPVASRWMRRSTRRTARTACLDRQPLTDETAAHSPRESMTRCRHPGERPRHGFSLIELLITLAVLAVLAGSRRAARADGDPAQSRSRNCGSRCASCATPSTVYKKASDEGRISRSMAGDTGYPKTLAILVAGEEDLRDPKHRKIYFLRRIPRDPLHPR